jgi:hypothetical protein
LDLLVGIAQLIETAYWIGRSIKRLFLCVFRPRSPQREALEWGDWLMLGFVGLVAVVVLWLMATGA